jgi:ectoine hydroxylase-related dioxygenase (phytanoyl-CoA dioxygenase family)
MIIMKKESVEERKKRLEKEVAELRAEWKSWEEFSELCRTNPEAARAAAEASRARGKAAARAAVEASRARSKAASRAATKTSHTESEVAPEEAPEPHSS